ncbi:MAG: hypothetical protein CVU97_00075 [Firmicutes bacterium HGW-Firmicutes-21]|nr:MAG: hypothetical protein CVU97_00075 [Firmicutes bacterium HGW-Firmicutes-21]
MGSVKILLLILNGLFFAYGIILVFKLFKFLKQNENKTVEEIKKQLNKLLNHAIVTVICTTLISLLIILG